MKKIVAFILTLGMIFSLAACGGENKETGTTSKKLDYANMTADDLLKDIKDQQNVTLDEFVALVSTYSYVTITDDLELEENITTEAIKKLKENGAKLPSAAEYVEPLLKSEAPQVRGYAISNVGSFLGVSDSHIAAAKELLKTENDPYVIRCAVQALANEGGKDVDIGAFLLSSAKSENSIVRKQAAMAIGSSWNKDLDGAVDAMITLMSDSDNDVRSRAYEYAGGLGDEKIIEPIVNMLNNPEDAELHGNGIDSLNKLWYDFPFHEKTSEAAYRETMDYFKTTPRTKDVPSWTAVGRLKKKNDSHYDEWRAKATYFNADEFAQIMTEIIKDTNANSFARSGAVENIAAHCSKETFDSLAAVIDGLTDKDAKSIQEKYKSQAEKLNK
ncbi:MAG: HEAT repeat domain-containing protein [Clostridia bacterium]|nr:HEAT repeat domain-containing protein [Clostridia bacterium]